MNIETTLIIGIIILSILIFLILKLEWVINQIRCICKEFDGFIKFIQTIFIISCWSIFIIILLYYLIFNPNKEVPILEIFLTVIVGFLGAISGLFFSNDALKELKDRYYHKMSNEKVTLLRIKNKINNMKEKLKENINKK